MKFSNKFLSKQFSFSFLVAGAILSSTLFGNETRQGKYAVPVDSEELLDSSQYDTEYKFHEKDGEITRMKYNLPLELTGVENAIDISYTGDEANPWQGDNAQGDCQKTENGQFTCQLLYTKEKLVLDEAKTEEAIKTKFAGNDLEIQRRLEVAKTFRSEPRGTTDFPLQSQRRRARKR